MALAIAALVKQIPKFEAMELGPDGRLVRAGLELEMNAYCRRAVAQAVELAHDHGGTVCVITLGPPAAEEVLREAIAWGLDREVATTGVLITDPAFAGSDTLATAMALSAAVRAVGPFDLVLTGRNSVDADTGQVGPEVAELLDLPFATGVRHLALDGTTLDLRCEHDDGWVQVRLDLPAVLSTAERLIDPCKVDPEGRAAVPSDRIRVLAASDVGGGPWGQAASPTRVGRVRVIESERLQHLLPDSPVDEQVRRAIEILTERGALDPALDRAGDLSVVPAPDPNPTRTTGVLVEPDRPTVTRELLGAAAALGGRVVALAVDEQPADVLGSWGADEVLVLRSASGSGGAVAEEDVATGATAWVREIEPWALIAPSTAWGREVASRTAAAVGAGLTGDAVGFELDGDRLIAWKPAFGGQLVAAIHADSPTQIATARAGMLPELHPRIHRAESREVAVASRGRVHVLARTRDDDLDLLAEATVVIGVGQGVAPEDYGLLEPLRDALGAEIAATRKVTDRGWLPRARQVGITGQSIAPRLFVSLGASGKYNHMVGVRAARSVLAINTDPGALVFGVADVGIVGDWHDVLPLLVRDIQAAPPLELTMSRLRRHPRAGVVLVLALALAGAACESSATDKPARETTTTTDTKASPQALPTVVPAACAGTLRRSSPGTLQTPDVKEPSGLVVSAKNPGTIWLNNDSGDSARVFAVSPKGALQGIYPLEGATAIDWEAIAIGPGPQAKVPYLYVGDIGDNAAARPSIVVYRVAEPKVASDGGTHPLTGVDALTLTYPDRPHDAEALMVDPRSGEIYIIIKHYNSGPAEVYRAPANLAAGSTTVLTQVGAIDLPRAPLVFAVTASDISRDGRAIAVRTYGGVRLWNLGPNQTVIDALAAAPCEGPIPVEVQGETIGFDPDARDYFTVSEGANMPLHQFTAPKPKP